MSGSDLIARPPLTRYKAGLSRRDGGSRSAEGGRVATVLGGARGPAQVRPGRTGATVEIIRPMGEEVDRTKFRCLDRRGVRGLVLRLLQRCAVTGAGRPTRPRPSTAVRPRAVSWFGSAGG